MPGLVFLPRRHSNQGMALRCQRATSHLSPRQYVTSPSRIIPSPATSESFNGVDPGTKGRENTRCKECPGKAIEQPHDKEWPIAHGAYLGGMAPPRRPYRPTGRMYAKQRGAYDVHKAIIFVLVQCVFLVAGPGVRRNTDQNKQNEKRGRREGRETNATTCWTHFCIRFIKLGKLYMGMACSF